VRRVRLGHEPAGTSQGERYTMNETINIVRCRQPDEFDDRLAVPPKRHAASGCTGDGWRPKLSFPRDGRGARKTCGRRLRYVGDIIIEGEDRYGDAVNIAARLPRFRGTRQLVSAAGGVQLLFMSGHPNFGPHSPDESLIFSAFPAVLKIQRLGRRVKRTMAV